MTHSEGVCYIGWPLTVGGGATHCVYIIVCLTNTFHRFEDLREPFVNQISEIRGKMLISPHKETAV